jgi:inner membrane protein
MHLQTHLMSGWCAGNLLPSLGARERLFCMIAAVAPDFDGVGRVFGEEAYWDYHHVVGHNLAFAVVLSAALAAFSTKRVLAFAAYFALAHLHLLMDYFGSGPGWGIPYFWPFDKHAYTSPNAWAFYSWQNLSTAGVMLAWTLLIVDRYGRTPLERLMPSLDRQLVEGWSRRVRRRQPSPPPAPATARPA